MMTKLEQAARQALEALEELFHSNSTKVAVEKYNTAHTALREALAEQAEQSQQADASLEPFLEVFYDLGYFDMWCVRDVHYKDYNHTIHVNSKESANHAKALIESWVRTYAAPVCTKDLTDDEVRVCFKATNTSEPLVEGWPGLERFARTVIEKFKEKNRGNV